MADIFGYNLMGLSFSLGGAGAGVAGVAGVAVAVVVVVVVAVVVATPLAAHVAADAVHLLFTCCCCCS